MSRLSTISLQRIGSITVFAACSLCSLQAAPIELLPEAKVESHGIFLDEIVSPANNSALLNIQLASAPKWGQTLTLTRAEVLSRISEIAPLVPTNNIIGASEIKISRQARALEEAELATLLREQLQPGSDPKRDGLLDLRLQRWKPVPVPIGPLEIFILDKPATGLAARFMVRFELRSNGEPVGTYTTLLEARLIREVWIAQSTIRRGTRLDEADVVLEPRDVINLRTAPWTDPVPDPAFHFVEGVPTGAVVFDRAVRLRPVVRRNQYIQAVFREGTLSISAKVQALEDGAPGDIIRARNLQSRKEVQGEVINEDTIKINL